MITLKWARDNGEYTTQDLHGRTWRLRQTDAPDRHWALDCDGRPDLSTKIDRVGGWRELDFAQIYIVTQD